jgi:DNA/RNA-binding domain of Phe-tRNA-synthetase-like protein
MKRENLIDELENQVREQVRDQAEKGVWNEVIVQMWHQALDKVGELVWHQMGSAMRWHVTNRVRHQVAVEEKINL